MAVGSAGTSPMGNSSMGRKRMSSYRKMQVVYMLVATTFYVVSLVLLMLGR